MWMTLTGLLVDARTVAADRNGFSAVPLRMRHEPDAAVAVLIVVPIGESRQPGSGLLDAITRCQLYRRARQLGTPEKGKSTAAQLVSAIERR